MLGLVGKAVTFDTGGISIKPAAKMGEMKFDMSGGAAVIEAVGAIARLAAAGAGRRRRRRDREPAVAAASMKPGRHRARRERHDDRGQQHRRRGPPGAGRLPRAREAQGAERLVDIATLTGGCVVALGSTYAGLMANDDELGARSSARRDATGELAWRLPLHEEYADAIKGSYARHHQRGRGPQGGADHRRRSSSRASPATSRGRTSTSPGMAWDSGKAYAAKGGNGFGVRLLVRARA